MLRTLCLAAWLTLLAAGTANAQTANVPSQLQPTLAANELLVWQIREALPSSDLDIISQRTSVSLSVGEQLETQLSQALAEAPDDATRSRVEGVLTHTQAAVASLRQARLETTLDAARGRLEQARGEAQEALDELRPFVLAPTLPAEAAVALPAELPAAGSLYGPEIAALPVIGVALIVIGLSLRLGARSR
jgi:hypothetical protein